MIKILNSNKERFIAYTLTPDRYEVGKQYDINGTVYEITRRSDKTFDGVYNWYGIQLITHT